MVLVELAELDPRVEVPHHQLILSGRVCLVEGPVVASRVTGAIGDSLDLYQVGDELENLFEGRLDVGRRLRRDGHGDGSDAQDGRGQIGCRNGEKIQWEGGASRRRRSRINRLGLIKSERIAGHLGQVVQDYVLEEFRVAVWRRWRLSRSYQ